MRFDYHKWKAVTDVYEKAVIELGTLGKLVKKHKLPLAKVKKALCIHETRDIKKYFNGYCQDMPQHAYERAKVLNEIIITLQMNNYKVHEILIGDGTQYSMMDDMETVNGLYNALDSVHQLVYNDKYSEDV